MTADAYLLVAEHVDASQYADDAYTMTGLHFHAWWLDRFKDDGHTLSEEAPEHIVLSLCFMAAMVEAGDA